MIFSLFAACASSKLNTLERKVELVPGIKLPLILFKDVFPKDALVKKLIRFERNENVETAQVVIKNHEILRMTVLTPLGIELLSLELKNNELYKRSGLPGINIKEFERAMVDIIAIYAKQMDLKRSVRENRQKIQIEDTAKRRKFIAGEKTLVDIKYSSDDLWGGKIELTNTPLKYKLIINTLSVDYENIHQ